MSVPPAAPMPDASDAAVLLGRAAAASLRPARGRTIAAQLFAPTILDERTRAAVHDALRAGAEALADALRQRGMDVPQDAPEQVMRAQLLGGEDILLPFWRATGLQLIGERLPFAFVGEADRPSLLARLAQDPRREIAEAAIAVLAEPSPVVPQAAAEALAWTLAATAEPPVASATVHAAVSVFAIAGPAERLAVALSPAGQALAEVVEEALAERQLALVAALLAQAASVDPALVADMVLDAEPARLVVLLCAIDLPRSTAARIGFALSEADGARDVDAFADVLDAADRLDADQARAALDRIAAPASYHAARRALEERR